MMRILTVLAALSAFTSQAAAFSSAAQRGLHHASSLSAGHQRRRTAPSPVTSGTVLRISDSPPSDGKGGTEKAKDKKKSLSTVVIDKSDTQMEEDETPEEIWRVVLHNDEATVTSCWKEQAMKYCLGLQRQGLTASIAPETKFEGGGGGEPESG
ncbi:hypothetical protein ACHAXA_000626 [Cyclostephanos tholiformis]|uniref:Uncharacterized protein n=1 Tax=Cyclostephanos tholiformis TaxID=382380 RepID=A0ABD3SQU2_9STRA